MLSPDGELAGFLTKAEIASRAHKNELSEPVSAAMVVDIPVVELREPLEHALNSLQKPEVSIVAVKDRAGNFLGYITRENIGEWVILHRRT